MHGMQEDVVRIGQKNMEAERWWAERLCMKHASVPNPVGFSRGADVAGVGQGLARG